MTKLQATELRNKLSSIRKVMKDIENSAFYGDIIEKGIVERYKSLSQEEKQILVIIENYRRSRLEDDKKSKK